MWHYIFWQPNKLCSHDRRIPEHLLLQQILQYPYIWLQTSLGPVWIPLSWRNWYLLKKLGYLAWNLRFHNFPKFTYKPISNS
jgi:hypothetical protein